MVPSQKVCDFSTRGRVIAKIQISKEKTTILHLLLQ